MKIPKYISKMLDRQTHLGGKLLDVNLAICEWCEKNGIDLSESKPGDDLCSLNSIMLITEPLGYERNIREKVLDKEHENVKS